MNILMGSHGVGKTTLLTFLKSNRPNLYITDGVSRPVKNIVKSLNLDSHQEQFIINELTEWNWIQNLNNPIYTCTRSIIDSYVYSKCLGFEDLAEKSLKIFLTNQPQKINYFYIPIEFELQKDGVRFEDVNFQKQIDEEIRSFIDRFNLNIVKLSGSVEERLSVLTTIL